MVYNSELEPELMVLFQQDGRIKTWDFTKKNNSVYISQFGKNLPQKSIEDNLKVQNIVAHPEEEGILNIGYENQSVLYDLYSE